MNVGHDGRASRGFVKNVVSRQAEILQLQKTFSSISLLANKCVNILVVVWNAPQIARATAAT